MYFFKVSIVFFALFLYSVFSLSSPIIGIGSMYDVLKPESNSLSKRIYNTGTSTAFIRVDILEVNYSPDFKANEVNQKEVNGKKLESNRLIVTPARLIIPPSGFQTVRVIWPGSRDKEHYYRVRFTPVLPEENDGFGIDKSVIDKYKQDLLEAGLNVLTGYGSVVIVQPEFPNFNTLIKDSDNSIIIKNNGNTTISLDEIRYCKTVKTNCGSASRQFILPGKTFKLEKQLGNKITFTLVEGESNKFLTY